MAKLKDVSMPAVWDKDIKIIFCDLCIKEAELGNRPTTHFNKKGWQNIVKNFQEKTGREYNKTQLKNKWDQIKKDWKLWKELKYGSIGLGWDPIRKTIDVSEEWWKEKLQVVPNAKKFRFCGIDPELEEKLDTMFIGVVATGEHVWAPTVEMSRDVGKTEEANEKGLHEANEKGLCEANEISEEGLREINEKTESSCCKRSTSQQTLARKRNKVGAGFLRDQISQLVTICSSWTSSTATVHAGSSISDAIKLLDSIPEVYDDMPFYLSCVKLIEDSVKREVFMSLGPSRRLPYLHYCCDQSDV